MKRGHYIIFEGGEGCGKSTQAEMLHEYFNGKGIPNIYSREPGGVETTEEIRKILLHSKKDLHSLTELFLFEAARTEYFFDKVAPNLMEGITVISDRSGYSTEAYQGYAGGMNLSLIQKLNQVATFGIKPNLTFIIDIDPKEGLEKELDGDRFAKKGLEYHTKVNNGFREVAKRNSECIVIPYIRNGKEEMHENIITCVETRLSPIILKENI